MALKSKKLCPMELVTGHGQPRFRQSRQMDHHSPFSSRFASPLPWSFILMTNTMERAQVTQGDVGKAIATGEFVSMTTLHNTIPGSVPAPIAWGTYATDSNIHFFLCNFVEMSDELPNIQAFTAKIAELHTKGLSPNGKYGFSVPTYLGQMPQYTTWTDSWEEFFINSLKQLMSSIEEVHGPDVEWRELLEVTINKVVPRLLRPLETGGRQIQPRLVHGYLYAGNVSVDVETSAPILFDAICLHAHNEYKLEMMDIS
ncbi:hypothetical protein GP486_002686 [Trichoglossum hirsutum]|uniref:protein-ribulosamine 3-kinase n=1 Tax=Trichoglossum hirsutum TaxID=265104 RepID=A0A9P8LEI7_9PEZI|nr:hypothetical protein GP486_002686 [Trichoglossum hirsutum]